MGNINYCYLSRDAIAILSRSALDFLNYIGPCPVECYKYKWGC